MRASVRGLLVALLASACGSTPQKTRDLEPRAMPGLELRLTEERDGDVWRHVSDGERGAKPDRIDVRSKLTLSFGEPPDLGLLEADPQWLAVDEAIGELQRLAAEYAPIAARAASLPPEGSPETAALQSDATRFGDELLAALRRLIAADGEPGIFADEQAFSDFLLGLPDPTQPYPALIAEVQARRHALIEKARAAHDPKKDVLVTVRAVLDPQVGAVQLLQVPGYYEKSKDDLADDLERARNKEFDRLKAEYDASRNVADSIRELQEKRGELRDALRAGLDTARERLRGLERSLDELIEARATIVRDALAGTPPDTGALTPEEQEAWTSLMGFVSDVRALRALVDDFPDEGAVDPLAALQSWAARFQALRETFVGAGEDSWRARLETLAHELEAAATAVATGPVQDRLRAFAAQLRGDWKALLDGLAQLLPKTEAALEALEGIGVFDHALGELPIEDGTEIPHPGDDLPAAVLDLDKNPITHGDELQLVVNFWRKADYESRRSDPKAKVTPLETIEYTSKAIRIGWRWSGDVIFTRPFDGPLDDHFEVNAAVSREYHWFERSDPGHWLNDLDPGVGLHAAQLNMDPDSSVEFGAGVSASLWDGLLRGGVGYNISVDDDHAYWFFGFGLISALDRLDQLRSKTFGDGD
jgi:hypothetical protein